MLWFVQHYLWGLVAAPNIDQGLHHAWTEGYWPSTAAFADAVVEELEREPDADGLLPRLPPVRGARARSRARARTRRSSHFVHIPWPQPDYWRVLPDEHPPRGARGHARQRRRQLPHRALAPELPALLRGRRSARRATSAPAEVTYEGRTVAVHPRPISVDPAEFADLAESERVLEEEAKLEAERPELLIVRVDRTDPSKNIVRGFRAFELSWRRTPSCTGASGCSRSSTRRARTFPSTRSTWARSSAPRACVNDRFRTRAGFRSISGSRTTSTRPSPRTSSTTSCS